MDLSKLDKKTLKVSRGHTYTYYTSPAQDGKPTLLLFHGWPDTAKLWAPLINDHLVPNGYGVVAPDCLGYGGTSKPKDVKEYGWQHMAADATEIVDAEKLSKVVSVGHDWGSCMAQRFYNFNPSRTSGLVMVNVSYMPPTGNFDLDTVNKATKEAFGGVGGIFEYWYFFTADDSTDIMSKNLESVYTVGHGEPSTWTETFCTPGGMRAYISEGRTQPTLPYANAEHRADFFERFSPPGAFEGPSNWYKGFTAGVQNEADKLVAQKDWKVNVPTLYWGGEGDVVCRPAGLQASIDAGLLPDVKKVTRPGGHWALLENTDVFGKDVLEWLKETTFA